MFGPLGFQEVLFIAVLALLIFGPKRLPEIGRTIGKGMAQFRKASNDLKRSIETEIALEDRPAPPRRPNVFLPPGAGPATEARPAATERAIPTDVAPGSVAAPPAAVTDPPASDAPERAEPAPPADPSRPN